MSFGCGRGAVVADSCEPRNNVLLSLTELWLKVFSCKRGIRSDIKLALYYCLAQSTFPPVVADRPIERPGAVRNITLGARLADTTARYESTI